MPFPTQKFHSRKDNIAGIGQFQKPRRSVRTRQLRPYLDPFLTELVENLIYLLLRAILPNMAVDKFASECP